MFNFEGSSTYYLSDFCFELLIILKGLGVISLIFTIAIQIFKSFRWKFCGTTPRAANLWINKKMCMFINYTLNLAKLIILRINHIWLLSYFATLGTSL